MIYIYSFIMNCIAKIAPLFSSHQFFSTQRNLDEVISKIKNPSQPCALFFCSSAGEYEQAKPIINALKSKYFIHIFFFSTSGTSFADRRGESVSYSLTPADTIHNWQIIFQKLKPTYTFVVRHELWPAFLNVAKQYSMLILLSYSESQKPGVFKKFLLKNFHEIMCIHQRAASSLDGLSLPARIKVTGDTKADRVFERVRKPLQDLPIVYSTPNLRHLIIGSAWLQDVKVIAPAFKEVMVDTKSAWHLSICPHDLSPKNLQLISNYLHSLDLEHSLFSISPTNAQFPCTIVDKLGILADLYQYANASFVGGALHHRVHNVLEPAVYGIEIGFGPLFHNSPEACHLIDERCATIINDVASCKIWLKSLMENHINRSQEIIAAAKKLSGGTKNILNILEIQSHGLSS